MTSEAEMIEVELEETVRIPESLNYEDLRNLPTLDGVPIKGNIKERDPTVPDWAKSPEKPAYSAEEIGAISKIEMKEIDPAELESMWESI